MGCGEWDMEAVLPAHSEVSRSNYWLSALEASSLILEKLLFCSFLSFLHWNPEVELPYYDFANILGMSKEREVTMDSQASSNNED